MKLSIELLVPSKQEWLEAVLNNFDAFLQDHANAERKVSAMAMSFVAKFPDRVEIIPDLIETAIEELEHFRDVYALMEERGLQLVHSIGEDHYAKALIKRCHSGRNERFLDRLLIASVMETRGGERFRMVAEAVEDPELAKFYKRLWASEAGHAHIFVKMALNYFDEDQVYARLNWWMEQEAEVIEQMEVRPAVH